FFFQAEDGIRDFHVTGVQTCALPILLTAQIEYLHALGFGTVAIWNTHGGNSAVLTYTIRELQSRTGLRIGRLESGFKPELNAQEAAFGFHAGHWETALMRALDQIGRASRRERVATVV